MIDPIMSSWHDCCWQRGNVSSPCSTASLATQCSGRCSLAKAVSKCFVTIAIHRGLCCIQDINLLKASSIDKAMIGIVDPATGLGSRWASNCDPHCKHNYEITAKQLHSSFLPSLALASCSCNTFPLTLLCFDDICMASNQSL